VNTYRVEEAKRLLHNPRDPKITVLEVMYQAGFNSKSSFNTAFKKVALTTPSAYKKKGRPETGGKETGGGLGTKLGGDVDLEPSRGSR
jgi:AraC-like DNA-binding protein